MSEKLHLVCAACGAVNRVPLERISDNPACGRCQQKVLSGEPVSLDTKSFEIFINRNDVPVVVDFWASWCGPCKAMAPAFAETAMRMEPGVRFAKLDTEAAQSIAAKFAIRSIPTMIMFQGSKEMARQAGAMGAADIERWVRSVSK